ncbi:MAG TPA: hypothetical protein VF060_23005 [Trebonia sp.]
MIIDCGRCTVRGVACESCAVTFITGTVTFDTEAAPARAPAAPGARPKPANALVPPRKSRGTTTTTGKPTSTQKPASAPDHEPVIELDAAEVRALAALVNAGLIPPLRYAPSMAKAS